MSMRGRRRTAKKKPKPKHHTIHREGLTIVLQCNGKTVASQDFQLDNWVSGGSNWIAEAVAKHKEECERKR